MGQAHCVVTVVVSVFEGPSGTLSALMPLFLQDNAAELQFQPTA